MAEFPPDQTTLNPSEGSCALGFQPQSTEETAGSYNTPFDGRPDPSFPSMDSSSGVPATDLDDPDDGLKEFSERMDKYGKKLFKEYQKASRGIEFYTRVHKALREGKDDPSFRAIGGREYSIASKYCAGYQLTKDSFACRAIVVRTSDNMRRGRCTTCIEKQKQADKYRKSKARKAEALAKGKDHSAP